MNMKRIISIILAVAAMPMAATAVKAQSAYDAFNYSTQDYYGTARSIAMGNAFTALGGDMGGISINPAGSGVYRYSEIAFTLGGSFSRTNASGMALSGHSPSETGFSNNVRNAQNVFTMPNFGAVLNFNLHRTRGLKAVNIGFFYNRTQDYNMAFGGSGINAATSWAGALAAGTNGISSSRFDRNSYFSGLPWGSVLGWNTGAISNFGNAPDTEYAGITENIEQLSDGSYRISTGGDLDQRASYRTYGNKSDLIINAGFNFSDIIYAGVNLGFVMMDYTMDSRFSEYAVNPLDFQTGFVSLRDRYVLQTTGRGFYAKFGIIARPIAGLRIGAAIQTPTGTTISERWFEDLDVVSNGGSSSDGTPEGNFNYRLTSPFRYNLGLAYTFGNFGLISFDYESVNYGSMRFKNTDRSTDGFDAINDDIYRLYGASHSFRAGLEININPYVAVRGGFNMITPGELSLQGNSGNNTYIYSGGLGFKTNGSFYADLAFRYNDNPDIYYKPYADYIDDMPSPQLRVKNKLMSFVATIGFRF